MVATRKKWQPLVLGLGGGGWWVSTGGGNRKKWQPRKRAPVLVSGLDGGGGGWWVSKGGGDRNGRGG